MHMLDDLKELSGFESFESEEDLGMGLEGGDGGMHSVHRFVVGEYTAATSYDFLLPPITPSVSCSCLDALNTPSSKLPLSPTVSRFLQPV